MKESRFIELLNLYVDQELSPTEAAELEAEIAAKPARRRTYEQYCRMQKGCAMLFEAVRANAPEYTELASAGHAAERKVLDFPVNRTARRSFLPALAAWGGGIAAAAAVVTVLLVREPAGAPGGQSGPAAIASTESSPSPATPAPVSTERPTHYQLAAQLSLSPDRAKSFPQAEQPDFEWMQRMQFAAVPRLSPEDLRFVDEPASRPATQLKDTVVPYQPGETFNAFEFRR